ncbi:MAG: hypothetical protein HOP33_19090 [Verrucomicrobia bacterium]|nr:hypothetical protein [Verrucomicrobiota bacterium]
MSKTSRSTRQTPQRPENRGLLRLVEDDTAALRDFQTGSNDRCGTDILKHAGKDAGAPRLPVLTVKSSRTFEEYCV